jgi:S-DNA-T family DNA segregation ATPase FtsK/SpoIIIE
MSRRSTASAKPPAPPLVIHGLREGALIACCALALYLLLALGTYSPTDPGWSSTGHGGAIENAGGPTGAWVADVLLSLFGRVAYLFPVLLGFRAYRVFRDRSAFARFDPLLLAIRSLGFVLVVIAATALVALHVAPGPTPLPSGNGGMFGEAVARAMVQAFSVTGSQLLLVPLLLFGVTVFTDLSWLKLMDDTGRQTLRLVERSGRAGSWLLGRIRALLAWWQNRRSAPARPVIAEAQPARSRRERRARQEPKVSGPEIRVLPPPPGGGERAVRERQGSLFSVDEDGQLPPLGLLDARDQSQRRQHDAESLQARSQQLVMKLQDFGIDVEVKAVYPGPVITRFEVQPAPGMKVSKISNLVKDLARSLAVISVRVVEVIPGKTVIGIEIPNEDRDIVMLSEVLGSKAYDAAKSSLSLALGHDISGQPVVVDLAKMPHLLVAGTTGSGKSVGVNGMLLSLLYKASPADVRLMLVDPKMLELSVYEGIPHLLTPVITDMKDAANGLRWCVAEMERRYQLMAALGVRNLAGFNRKVREAAAAGEPIPDPTWQAPQLLLDGEEPPETPALEALPAIVVVIDEFADMMMIVGKKVEELIARIAQKARAAGIHLVLATQRPSVDVITGLIKANIPTRISFQVSSKVDSRTILDQGGAEQLLGHGDMLYLPPGSGVPIRVHGAFVSDDEVHRVVAHWRERSEPNYIEGLLDDVPAGASIPGLEQDSDDPEADQLYDEAVRYVTESRKASISSVQRKLRIGYNRAARMIEAMEAAGVVSEMNSNGSREVLAPPPV